MKTENVYLVIFLVILIVGLSNLMMYLIVRGGRNFNLRWMNGLWRGGSQPFSQEDRALEELSRRVREIESKNKKDTEE
ncbi:MAG: hypothetical protein WHS87_10220 [Anaerolineales bacterium]